LQFAPNEFVLSIGYMVSVYEKLSYVCNISFLAHDGNAEYRLCKHVRRHFEESISIFFLLMILIILKLYYSSVSPECYQ